MPDIRSACQSARGAQPTIAGNVNEVIDIVNDYVKAGVNELIVPDFTMGQGAQKIETLDRFINEVASNYR